MLMGALSGCHETEEEADGRFALHASLCGPLDSLDPAMNTDARAESVFGALFENLMRLGVDEAGNTTVEPAAAREYKVVENYDGTVDYVFTLRSAARWSDGTRLKAQDFVYAWRRLVNPVTNSPHHSLLSMVQGYDVARETGDATRLAVTAENDSTLRVTLAAPCLYFLSDVCTATATMPLRSDFATKNPDWATSGGLPGNGPYQVGAWSKAEYLQLRRNGSYHESRAVLPDTLRFVFAGSAEKAWQRYVTGDLDFVTDPPAGTEGVVPVPRRSTVCVLYNHMGDVFSNEHVRRAFDLSLDRPAIATAVGAAATPATGLVPPGVVNTSIEGGDDFRAVGGTLLAVDAEGYSMRCIEAGNELRSGGYWGGEGFPSVTCLYVAEDEVHAAVTAAALCWREQLNVSVVSEGVSREEFNARVDAGEYDLAIDVIDVSCGDAMTCLAPFAGADADNVLHYASKPYDLLIGVAETAGDPAAESAFLHDAELLLLGDTALSPLCFGGTACLLREGLSGLRFNARGNVYFDAVTSGRAVG